MGPSIMTIYEMQEIHSLYWKIELSDLMQNDNICFATSNLHENPVRTMKVGSFDIDVNNMVLELVVVATVVAGVKPKNQSIKQKYVTLKITRHC